MAWIKAGKISDIDEGKAIVLQIGPSQVALFKQSGHFYAIENRCGHRGGPLADGHCEDGIVTCPWHGWTFDVRTGACRNVPEGFDQKTFATKVEGGEVFVSDASSDQR